MKKINYIIFTLFVSAFLIANLNALEGYTTEANIRVRKEANTSSEIIEQISSKHTTLDIISEEVINEGDPDCSAGWYKIKYNGSENYICGVYVSIGKNPSQTSSEINYNTNTFDARVNALNVYARSGAGYGYSTVMYFLPGTNVTIIGDKIKGQGCSDGWYLVKYHGTNTGYVCSTYVDKKEEIIAKNDEYSEILKKEGFPDTYIQYLNHLHKIHPTWSFKAVNTNLYWDNVVSGESNKNLVQSTNLAYIISLSMMPEKNWYVTRDSVNAFYLDPRNFLTERFIFMFQSLAYNYGKGKEEKFSKDNEMTVFYYNAITSLLEGSYLNTDEYKYAYIEAGWKYNVSPVHLVSRTIQEGGSRETYLAVSGTSGSVYGEKSLNGYYNYYNIGSYGDNPVYNGLVYACGKDCNPESNNSYGRPWNSRVKAIDGGADFISTRYVNSGQNTLYLQKFNTTPVATYANQYMSNVLGAAYEAEKAYESYKEMDALNDAYVFNIPVYLEMPESVSLPSIESTINTLESITINNENVTGFDSDILEYTKYVDKQTEKITINATKTDIASTIEGVGEIKLDNNETKINITVTSESGSKKIYVIKVIKVENITSIADILSGLSVKVDGSLMYGISPKTQVNTLVKSIEKNGVGSSMTITDAAGNAVDTNSNLKTGFTLLLNAPNGESKAFTIVVTGDASGDGEITILDLLKVQKHLVASSKLDGAYLKAADTNDDKQVTILDLLRVQKVIMKQLEF